MEIKKYTPDQLSRILSVAAVGELGNPAYRRQRDTVCIEQAAFSSTDSYPNGLVWKRMRAWDGVSEVVRPQLPVPVLRWLEGKGFA